MSFLIALGSHRAAFRNRFWLLFVVAGSTFGSHCFSSMLDSDAICRGRTCSRDYVNTLLSLLVVAGHAFGNACFIPKWDLIAICRVPGAFWRRLVVAEHRLPLDAFLQKSTLIDISRVWSYFWRYNLYFLIFFLWF